MQGQKLVKEFSLWRILAFVFKMAMISSVTESKLLLCMSNYYANYMSNYCAKFAFKRSSEHGRGGVREEWNILFTVLSAI